MTVSYSGRSTRSRGPAMQNCPVLNTKALMTAPIAASTSASAKRIFAALPPSSATTGVRCSPAVRATTRPIFVEPVKAIMSTPSCRTSASPSSGESPVTTLYTPSGTPASRRISAISRALSGVCGAGLWTTTFPAASAGASFELVRMIGKLNGVIAPTTPRGSVRV